MNKLVVVGSCINPRDGNFTYSNTRSKFNAEERFRQTLFTINSLQNSLPEAKIVVVDSSDDVAEYESILSYHKSVEFIHLKKISKDVHEIVNTHVHKTFCECLMLNAFYDYYNHELSKYDYIIKATGRYFYYNLNDNMFNIENKNKIFFKKPLSFNWSDSWGYSFVDRRAEQNDNNLYQYSTILYAFGYNKLKTMIELNKTVMNFLSDPSMGHYDIETLSYHFLRPHNSEIIETDWVVSGWMGTSGRYVYY